MSKVKPLTDIETNEILLSFSGEYEHRDRAMFLLGLKTGFRISELLSLTVNDVWNSNAQIMRDYVTVQRKNMKRKISSRTVPINQTAKDAIERHIKNSNLQSNPDSFLFPSRKGENKPISRVRAYQILSFLANDCQINKNIGTHSMRKTFATKAYNATNHDLLKTQRLLGHRNINSTVQYLESCNEELDSLVLSM